MIQTKKKRLVTKIKVTGAEFPSRWYVNRIGEAFEVISEDPSGFQVDHSDPAYPEGTKFYVSHPDSQEIE